MNIDSSENPSVVRGRNLTALRRRTLCRPRPLLDLERRVGATSAHGIVRHREASRPERGPGESTRAGGCCSAGPVPTLRGREKWRHSSVQSAAGYRRRKPRQRTAKLPQAPTQDAQRALVGGSGTPLAARHPHYELQRLRATTGVLQRRAATSTSCRPLLFDPVSAAAVDDDQVGRQTGQEPNRHDP